MKIIKIKNMILLAIIFSLCSCVSVFSKTVKVNGVKVIIFGAEEVNEKQFLLKIRVKSDRFSWTITNEEQNALNVTFNEQAHILCQPNNYIDAPLPIITKQYSSGSVAYTTDIWFFMIGEVACE